MAAIRPNGSSPTTAGIVGGILDIRDEIRNPSPGNPVGPIGRTVCDTLASVGYDNIPLNSRTGPGFVCKPYWDDEGIDPPQDVPPFTGGQCAGTVYYAVVTYDAFSVNNGCEAVSETRNYAPIAHVGPIRSADPECTGAPDTGCQKGVHNQVTVVDNNNDAKVLSLGNTQCTRIVRSISFVRADGQPDTCGDPPLPPVSVPGPSNPGTPPGTPVPLPGFPGVTVIVGDPVVEGDDFYIPITINNDDGDPVGPPIFWTPDGIPPSFPPPPAPPVEPGDPQEPSGPAGDVPDDISQDEEDRGLETIGYEWTLTNLPANLSSVPGTSPRVLTTPYGNVQLRYEDSTGATRYSDNLPIRVVSGSIIRQEPSLKVKGVLYSRRPDVGGIRLVPLRSTRS